MKTNDQPIERREVLRTAIAATAIAGGLSVAGRASAQHEHHDHHEHHQAAHGDLAAAATHCSNKADECLAHCLASFTTGDTTLAQCAVIVAETKAICDALAVMALQESDHLKAIAALSIQVCTDCEAECRKHEMHPECKACADSCIACIDEAKKIAN